MNSLCFVIVTSEEDEAGVFVHDSNFDVLSDFPAREMKRVFDVAHFQRNFNRV